MIGGRARRRRDVTARPHRRIPPAARVPIALLGLACIVGLAVAVPHEGFTTTRLDTVPGSAWLPSYRTGQVTLIDGSTADVLAAVDVTDHEGRLQVVQAETNAFVLDRDLGTLIRVDGGTLDRTPATPLGRTASLRAFAGADAVSLYDRVRGALAVLDPQTLEVRRRIAVPTSGEDGIGIDANGRLWVIAESRRTVDQYDADGHVISRTPFEAAAGARMELAAGRPVVLDRSQATLRPIAADGTFTAPTCLPGADRRVSISGSPTRARVYVTDSEIGTLAVADLDTRTCDTSIEIASPGDSLGPPVEVGDAVLVANRTTSTVVIVDLSTRRVLSVAVPLPRGTDVDLVPGSGVAYYNDPLTDRAGVISLTGGRAVPLRKYDPDKRRGPTRPFRRRATTASSTSPSSTPSASQGTASPRSRPSPDPSTASVLQIAYNPPPAPEIDKPFDFRLLVSGPRQPASVSWTFGDGGTATGVQVEHAYTSAAEYRVTATAVFADGTLATKGVRVTVNARRVVQVRRISPREVREDVPTRFSATYENGPPTSYRWTVRAPGAGRRVIATSTQAQPTFTFADPTPDAGRPYEVSLAVDGGAETVVHVTVGPAAPSPATASCTPSRPVLGQRSTCTAVAGGYVSSWRWTITDPDGRVTSSTTESGSLVLPPASEGATTVSAVPVNRNGRGRAGRAVLEAATTVMGRLSCTPQPLTAGDLLSCRLTASGWSSRYTGVRWTLQGLTSGGTATGAFSGTSCNGSCTLRFSTRLTKSGSYRLQVTYVTPDGATRTRPGDTMVVQDATRTLTVVSLKGGTIRSHDGRVCTGGHTCRWTYPRGTQAVLTMEIIDDDYTLSGWQPDCGVARQGSVCAVTLDQDVTVTPKLGIDLLLHITLTAPGYCTGAANEDPTTCKPRNGPLTLLVHRTSGASSRCELLVGRAEVTCSYAESEPTDFELSAEEADGADFSGCANSARRGCYVRLTRRDQDVGVAFR